MTQHIDFHEVATQHREIDARLQNWGRWCNGRAAKGICPMFHMVRSSARARGELQDIADTIDSKDAVVIAKQVGHLPVPHRAAVQWAYVRPVNPKKACLSIGTNMAGLKQLLVDGRQMLMNRLAR